jgi:hypothetical protein
MAPTGVDYVSNPGLPLDEKTTDEENNAYDYMARCAFGSVKVMYCKLCSVWELTEQLNCKSMEIKRYIYMKKVWLQRGN